MPLSPEQVNKILRMEAAGELSPDEAEAVRTARANFSDMLPPPINKEVSPPAWAQIKAGFASNPFERAEAIRQEIPAAEVVVNKRTGQALYRRPGAQQFNIMEPGFLASLPATAPEVALSGYGATTGAAGGFAVGGVPGAAAGAVGGAGLGGAGGEAIRKAVGRGIFNLNREGTYDQTDAGDYLRAGLVNAAIPAGTHALGGAIRTMTPAYSTAAREAEASIARLRSQQGLNLPAPMLSGQKMTSNMTWDVVGNIFSQMPGGGRLKRMNENAIEAMRRGVERLFPTSLTDAKVAATDALIALRDTKRQLSSAIRDAEYDAIGMQAAPIYSTAALGKPATQIGGASFNTTALKQWAKQNADTLKAAGNVEREYGGGSVYDALLRASETPEYAVLQKQLSGINEYARNLKARGETGPALDAVTEAQTKLHSIMEDGLERVNPALKQKWLNANELVAHMHETLDNQVLSRIAQLAERRAADSPSQAADMILAQSPDTARNLHKLLLTRNIAGGHAITAIGEAERAVRALDSVAATKLLELSTSEKTGQIVGSKLRLLVEGKGKIEPHAIVGYLSPQSKRTLTDFANIYEVLEGAEAGGMGKFAGTLYGVGALGGIGVALYTGSIKAALTGLAPFGMANALGRLYTSPKLIDAIRSGAKYSPDKWGKTKVSAQVLAAVGDSLTQYNKDMRMLGEPTRTIRKQNILDPISAQMAMTPASMPTRIEPERLAQVPTTWDESTRAARALAEALYRGRLGTSSP